MHRNEVCVCVCVQVSSTGNRDRWKQNWDAKLNMDGQHEPRITVPELKQIGVDFGLKLVQKKKRFDV